MNLYKIKLQASDGSVVFHNIYRVVSENIPDAIGKATKVMTVENKMKYVEIEEVELIEYGIIC